MTYLKCAGSIGRFFGCLREMSFLTPRWQEGSGKIGMGG